MRACAGGAAASALSTDALVQRLRAYAREAVDEGRERILGNLRPRGAPLVLDVALPGAAYFSVAAGGLAEVLHLLGEDHVQVDRFIGASGGACSLFLILAHQPEGATGAGPSRCPSSELLLRTYLQYAASEGRSSITRSWNALSQVFGGVSVFWEDKYREVLQQNEAAFRAIRDRAFVAVAATPVASSRRTWKPHRPHANDMSALQGFQASSDNYVFHGFDNREQAVQAFVATGEASLKGLVSGVRIIDAAEGRAHAGGADKEFALLAEDGAASARVTLPATYCDGGHPVAFGLLRSGAPPQISAAGTAPCGGGRNALLYYNTWFPEQQSDAMFCSPESVERLFRSGVDRTIECLSSASMSTGAGSGADPAAPRRSDAMVVVMPGADPVPELAKIGRESSLAHGAFVSLRGATVCEVGGFGAPGVRSSY